MSHVTSGDQRWFQRCNDLYALATTVQIVTSSEFLLLAWEKLKEGSAGGCGGDGSESEGEQEGNFEGSTSATNRGGLRLRAPIKAQWISVFECIDRALRLKDAIIKFSKHDMGVDGRFDDKDDDEMLACKACRGGHKTMRKTHAHSLTLLLQFCILFWLQVSPLS